MTVPRSENSVSIIMPGIVRLTSNFVGTEDKDNSYCSPTR